MMGGFGSFGWGNGFGMMNGFGWFGGFICLLIIVLIIIGVVALVNRSTKSHYVERSGSSNSSAVEIAKNRYAKGEITKDQYDQILKDLK